MVFPIPKKTPLDSGYYVDPSRVLIESELGSHLDPNRVRNVCVHFANSGIRLLVSHLSLCEIRLASIVSRGHLSLLCICYASVKS